MAVTIHDSPDTYTPSDNPIVWKFSSDQTAQSNFSFVVELYVDGVLDSNHEIFLESGIYAHFDASEKMTPLTPSAEVGQTDLVTDASNHREVYIKVFERYGTPPSNQASSTSSTINTFKACLSDQEMESWSSTPYTVGNDTRQFLTALSDNISIRPEADFYLSIITAETSTLTLELEFFDVDGVSITTHSEAIANTDKITQARINLDKLVSDGVLTSLQADGCYHITAFIKFNALTQYSETKTILIDRECGYRGRHLIWLNHLGGFDQFTFRHNAVLSAKHQKKTFQKQFGNWSGTDYVLDAFNAGTIGYFTTAEDKIELTSDWLSEAVQNWLVKSLFLGVKLAIQTAVSTYNRCNLASDSYVEEQDYFTELFNASILLNLSNKRRSPKV